MILFILSELQQVPDDISLDIIKLDLSSNKIKRLQSKEFVDVPNLEVLNLSNNGMESIDQGKNICNLNHYEMKQNSKMMRSAHTQESCICQTTDLEYGYTGNKLFDTEKFPETFRQDNILTFFSTPPLLLPPLQPTLTSPVSAAARV